MPDTERTVSAVVRRERARRRLRGATAGAGILGLAAGGLVAYYLPSSSHPSSQGSTGTSSAAQRSAPDDSGNSGSDDHGSGSTSNSGSLGSSSAPATSSGPAAATSGGS